MPKDFSTMEDSNPSANTDIHRVARDLADPSRRVVLRGGLGATVGALLAPLSAALPLAGCASAGLSGGSGRLGFVGVPVSTADEVKVPMGYVADVLYAWGDPVGVAGAMPAFKTDASNSAAEQALQAGMHHDGMHFFPTAAHRGLLVMNHEYIDDGMLHTDGTANWSAEKVAKAQAAHGVSVIEIARAAVGEGAGGWSVQRPSKYARRITASTPMRIAGPAAGHALMQTAADATGTQVLGTFSNCAHGATPWGTYLACEENFVGYFKGPTTPADLSPHQKRWGLTPQGWGTRWHEHDERFDATLHPNEFNRHGWVVEIDPFDPTSTPVKRTALGRAAHEGAFVTQTADGRVVVYMGEDARFEYIYKFVSRDAVRPGGYAANRELLDHGTLYVARFDVDGTGRWLALLAGQGGLDAAAGFASQGEVLIKARQASDLLGGTKMDRPEWIAGDAKTATLYCSLTNNSQRGAPGQSAPDAANPRANNTMGQVIRWQEEDGFAATRFTWSHFVLAGDPANERTEAKGNVKGDAFGSPDGLWFDARGVLWIQTDASTSVMGKGDYARLGNNMLLAADPASGEVRRFLTGPVGCEITGTLTTPDMKTMFVNIQHPGEPANERTRPEEVTRFSAWPFGARPRSATVVVRRSDGGPIGT